MRRRCAETLPHPDTAALAEISRQTLDWVLRYHAALPATQVGRTASRAELETLLREPAPEAGQDFARVLAEFETRVAANAFRPNHPRFLAFIPSAPSFVSVLGDLLCAGTNTFCGVWLEASGPSMVELVVLDWLARLLGCPKGTRGIFTSGGSESNLTALVAARERLSYEDRGRAVLYLTEQRHWSMDRAARIIGMRSEQLRPVPADEHYRMTPAALAEVVERDRRARLLPWVAVANAGATNTGTVDLLGALAETCRAHRLWFHVDAAYGWPAVLTPEGQVALRGIGDADSITLDPHKWFGQTFEAACLLVRDGKALGRAFAMRPEYMQDVQPADDEVNFADQSLALTRRFRALRLWLSIKVLGIGWFRALVAHCCDLAELAQAMLEASPAFEITCPRQLSIVCFRFVPPGFTIRDAADEQRLDELNLAVIEKLRATGRAFISSTRLRGRVALRFCFVNWRTTARDVEEIVDLLGACGEEMS